MRTLTIACLLLLSLPAPSTAQDRIAFANVELILALMPETTEVNDALELFHRDLAERLQTKEKYGQQKLEEFQAAVAAGAPEADLEAFRRDLARLEQEIRLQAMESERKMAEKRLQLMEPVVEKLGAVFKELAEEHSYDFILNIVDGSGTSIVLHGPEDRDVTKLTLERMGVKIPGEGTAEEASGAAE